MTPDRWKTVRQVYEQALDNPAERRPALLDERCAGDPELRADVESLLQSHDRLDEGFLEPRGSRLRLEPMPLDYWARSLVGTHIGQYTLVRLLATGGMGGVFEALQQQPRRAVALKLLRPGLSATTALARFRLEPHVLGRLQHPNIAQVFEAGVHDCGDEPLPYFAMELIAEALTLSEYATTRELNLRSRIDLIAKVCDGVQHAHQKGVIHRDLKPANILINSDGEPKIIDFGVARASDADVLLTTQHTHAGDLIGTIRFMSPEQCDGDPARIDTRSDIYSLGVVLYELLTGVPPYNTGGKTTLAAIHVIKGDVPRRPSHVNRALRGDLDAILMKALEKNPSHRYSSAAEFAADLRRHLHGEPIEARPPGPATRAIKWAVRHPLTVSACASALVLVLAAIIGGTAYWYAMTRPDRVEISDDKSKVRLLTWADYPLRKWSSFQGDYHFALLTDRPAALGGGQLVLLGTQARAAGACAGGVAVFDCREKDTDPPTCWRLTAGQIPIDKIHARRGSTEYCWEPSCFSATAAILADVFDDPPGVKAEELVCFIKHQNVTHGAICVFRLDGTMLYRIWIDNDLIELYWAPGPRVLVCYGANGEAFIEEREVENPRREAPVHPLVVFGIEPVLHRFVDDYLIQEPSERSPAHSERLPLWYHCILPLDVDHPPALTRCNDPRLRAPEDPKYAEGAVLVTMLAGVRGDDASSQFGAKTWCVDAGTGKVIEVLPQADLYKRLGSPAAAPKSNSLPPFEDWRLGELPAKKKTSATSQSAPK